MSYQATRQLKGDSQFWTGVLNTDQNVIITEADRVHSVFMDASLGVRRVDLPDANLNPGRIVIVKKMDAAANNVEIHTNGVDLLDGAFLTALGGQYDRITLQSDGVSNWNVISFP